MATYTLTPARRAALRKAQLASAAKRRRHGTVPQTIGRAARQRAGYARASFQVKSRDFNKGSRTKRGLKYAAVGLGAAGAIGAAYGATSAARGYHYRRTSQDYLSHQTRIMAAHHISEAAFAKAHRQKTQAKAYRTMAATYSPSKTRARMAKRKLNRNPHLTISTLGPR